MFQKKLEAAAAGGIFMWLGGIAIGIAAATQAYALLSVGVGTSIFGLFYIKRCAVSSAR